MIEQAWSQGMYLQYNIYIIYTCPCNVCHGSKVKLHKRNHGDKVKLCPQFCKCRSQKELEN